MDERSNMKKLKIYLISPKGDELLVETDVVSEARKILEEYQKKGCSFAANLDTQVDSELVREIDDIFNRPEIGTIHILYPMAGGRG